VADGDEVTIGDFTGSPNDVIWEIFLAGTSKPIGESVFHLSCSDGAFNDKTDCNKAAGDGKSNDPALINKWRVRGITAASGSGFDCSVP